ncbi:MAG TPA: hypothetical protein VNL35_23215 [Chloroflexota bacterium]|nr:hypothetical protein [Chloroflexota bacterium]
MERNYHVLAEVASKQGGATSRGEGTRYPPTSARARPRRWWPVTLAVVTGITCVIGVPASSAAMIIGAAPLAGQLVSIGRTSLTIQTRGSQGTIATAATTGYYGVMPASARSLAVGETVAVSMVARASTAAAVVIVPAGRNLIVFVGTARGVGNGGSGDDGGGAGDGGSRRAGQELTGRITARSSGSITIQPISAAKTTITLTAATTLYRVTRIIRSQLRTGSYVATRANLGAAAFASDVVEAAPGMTISIGAAIGGQSSGE